VDDKFCRKTSVEWSDTISHDCVCSITGEVAFNSVEDFLKASHQRHGTKRP
jgi:hypothetical protein